MAGEKRLRRMMVCQESFQACEAKIYACLDWKDRTQIVIKQLNEDHNHEISADIFERYAKQRKLNEVESNRVKELVKLNIPPKDLRTEIVRLTGKWVIMQESCPSERNHRKQEKTEAHTVWSNS